MLMESDPNPFPKIDLFPRLTKLAHFLFDQLQNEGISDHQNRGGGPALDRALYDEPQLVYHSVMGDTTISSSRYKETH